MVSDVGDGRARAEEQKRYALEAILAAWMRHPQLRLGQMLHVASEPRDLFYIEDDELAINVEERF